MRTVFAPALFVVSWLVAGATSLPAATPAADAPVVSDRRQGWQTRLRQDQGCQRWRSALSRLGETYAGYRLRHALATRPCALASSGADEQVWGWPWRQLDSRADLPPQGHGTFGAWEIRCGEASGRRRCALAAETAMAAQLDPEVRPIRIVAHLVIDTVAGRESVLWRVHVAPGGVGPPAQEQKDGVSLELVGRSAIEPFDACGRRGCMAEAEPQTSAEVVSTLWAGRPITITLRSPGSDAGLAAMLTAHGFQAGFKELIRLRRNEGRALAGR